MTKTVIYSDTVLFIDRIIMKINHSPFCWGPLTSLLRTHDPTLTIIGIQYVALPFPLCIALWVNSVQQQHTQLRICVKLVCLSIKTYRAETVMCLAVSFVLLFVLYYMHLYIS